MQPITATSTPRERDETYFLLFGLQNGQRTWRGVWLLIGYYLFSLLFAAVMSAPTYWFVEWVDSFWSTEASQYLLGKNIDVYFERLRMGPLLLGLPWIMWMCRLLSFKALGFDFSWKHVKTACLWWVIGFVLIGLMAAGQVGSGTCVPREQLPSLGTQIFSSAFAALLIGFLEELIFRGLVLRLFYSAFGAFWAVVLSAAFYAYTHFRIPGGIVDVTPGDDAFFTGFQVGFWILFGIVKG